MSAQIPPVPRQASQFGSPLRGGDLALAAVLGLGLFWGAAWVLGAIMPDTATSAARINRLIGLSALWVFAWLFAIWFVFVRRRSMSFADLGYVVPTQTWAARGVIAGFIALPAAFMIYVAVRPLLGSDGGDARGYFGDGFTGIHAATLLLYAGFLVPITEELLFRGLLYRWLRQRFDLWPAAFVSAALFGIAHGRIDQMLIAGLLGVPLAWLYERSGSLTPAILMHQTYNSLMLMVTFAAVWFTPEAAGRLG